MVTYFIALLKVQVLVNISTPAEVFDRVDAAVGAHTSLHLGEFTGKRLVCARDAGDPLKYALCIFYEYCHNGEHPHSDGHSPASPPCPMICCMLGEALACCAVMWQ